jgi:dTDP-glucose 4,6-dehydratase
VNLYKPKTVLVTGSAGFIGSNFVSFFLRKDLNVTVISLDKLTYAGDIINLESVSSDSRHVFIKGDISDKVLVNKILNDYSIDTIIHFAAESHVDRSIDAPDNFIQTNIIGTFVLLEAARRYWLCEKKLDNTKCRFHHISTDEVYGFLGLNDPSFSESSPYHPSSPYAASKAASDHLVRSYFRTYGLPVSLSNCSNNYGPNQHGEKLIPTVIRSCLENRPIPVYGNGSNIRDWLYVEDHCHAIFEIIKKGAVGETYNVGGGDEKDNLSLIKMICGIIDQKKPQGAPYERLITFVPDRPGHDWRYAINYNKIKSALGWEPKYKLYDGLIKTINHYMSAY